MEMRYGPGKPSYDSRFAEASTYSSGARSPPRPSASYDRSTGSRPPKPDSDDRYANPKYDSRYVGGVSGSAGASSSGGKYVDPMEYKNVRYMDAGSISSSSRNGVNGSNKYGVNGPSDVSEYGNRKSSTAAQQGYYAAEPPRSNALPYGNTYGSEAPSRKSSSYGPYDDARYAMGNSKVSSNSSASRNNDVTKGMLYRDVGGARSPTAVERSRTPTSNVDGNYRSSTLLREDVRREVDYGYGYDFDKRNGRDLAVDPRHEYGGSERSITPRSAPRTSAVSPRSATKEAVADIQNGYGAPPLRYERQDSKYSYNDGSYKAGSQGSYQTTSRDSFDSRYFNGSESGKTSLMKKEVLLDDVDKYGRTSSSHGGSRSPAPGTMSKSSSSGLKIQDPDLDIRGYKGENRIGDYQNVGRDRRIEDRQYEVDKKYSSMENGYHLASTRENDPYSVNGKYSVNIEDDYHRRSDAINPHSEQSRRPSLSNASVRSKSPQLLKSPRSYNDRINELESTERANRSANSLRYEEENYLAHSRDSFQKNSRNLASNDPYHRNTDMGIRRSNSDYMRGARNGGSLEDTFDRKSVTWGENSIHDLIDKSRDDVLDAAERRSMEEMELREARRRKLEALKSGRRKRQIKADVSGTKYRAVYDAVQMVGMVISKPNETGCSLIWNDAFVSMEKISELEPHQRMNHFAGMDEICRTIKLIKNLNKMAVYHSTDYDFLPKSWVLPEDGTKLQEARRTNKEQKNKNKKKVYIVKPVLRSQQNE